MTIRDNAALLSFGLGGSGLHVEGVFGLFREARAAVHNQGGEISLYNEVGCDLPQEGTGGVGRTHPLVEDKLSAFPRLVVNVDMAKRELVTEPIGHSERGIGYRDKNDVLMGATSGAFAFKSGSCDANASFAVDKTSKVPPFGLRKIADHGFNRNSVVALTANTKPSGLVLDGYRSPARKQGEYFIAMKFAPGLLKNLNLVRRKFSSSHAMAIAE